MITRSCGLAMRRMAVLASVTCALVAMSTPAPAWATAAEDEVARATKLYDDGVAAAKLNHWEEARVSFLGAWQVRRHWQIAANLGRSEFKAGKTRDAAEHLAFFLREAPATADADARRQAQEMLAQARTFVGVLTVAAVTKDAEFFLDSALLGRGPFIGDLYVDPGVHKLEARKEGFETAVQSVAVSAGSVQSLTLELNVVEPLAPTIAPSQLSRIDQPEKRRWSTTNKVIVVSGFTAATIASGIGASFLVSSFIKKSALPARTDADVQIACRKDPTNCVYNTAEHTRALHGNIAFQSLLTAGVLLAGTITYAIVVPRMGSQLSVAAVAAPGVASTTLTVQW